MELYGDRANGLKRPRFEKREVQDVLFPEAELEPEDQLILFFIVARVLGVAGRRRLLRRR